MGTIELRRLLQLEEQNKLLKQLVADLSLDKQMLQDVIKKAVKPGLRKDMAIWLLDNYRTSVRRAFRCVMLTTSMYYYRRADKADELIRMRMPEIAATLVRRYVLLRREGFVDNHKLMYRSTSKSS